MAADFVFGGSRPGGLPFFGRSNNAGEEINEQSNRV
jgi:hypothetical protein